VICYADGGGELPTLWTGGIAASGVGKTELLRKLGNPFEAIERSYKTEMEQYQREIDAGNPAIQPKRKHLLVGNATMEAVFVLCAETSHGLLLSEPEGKLFFAFDSYRPGTNTDEANYCKLYDGTHFKISRKKERTIEGFGSMCVAILIQPGNFHKVLTHNAGMTTSGLLARMNLCYPAVGEFRRAKKIDKTAYSAWNDTISNIIGNRTEEGAIEVILNDEAQEAWDYYMDDCRNLARQTVGWLGGYYDRLHVTAMRIALQIHCFESACGVMNLDTIERGITIAEYMKSENERVAAMFSRDGLVDSEARVIIMTINRIGGEASAQMLKDRSSHCRRMKNLNGKLAEMTTKRILTVRVEKAANGREVKYYSVTPPEPGPEIDWSR